MRGGRNKDMLDGTCGKPRLRQQTTLHVHFPNHVYAHRASRMTITNEQCWMFCKILDARQFRLKNDEGWRRHWFHKKIHLAAICKGILARYFATIRNIQILPVTSYVLVRGICGILVVFFAPKRALMLLQKKVAFRELSAMHQGFCDIQL